MIHHTLSPPLCGLRRLHSVPHTGGTHLFLPICSDSAQAPFFQKWHSGRQFAGNLSDMCCKPETGKIGRNAEKTMQETQVQSLGHQEDPLEEEMATHFQYPCLENPMDRGAWQAAVTGSQRVRHDLATEHACTRQEVHEAALSFHPRGSS